MYTNNIKERIQARIDNIKEIEELTDEIFEKVIEKQYFIENFEFIANIIKTRLTLGYMGKDYNQAINLR